MAVYSFSFVLSWVQLMLRCFFSSHTQKKNANVSWMQTTAFFSSILLSRIRASYSQLHKWLFIRLFYHLKELYYWSDLTCILKHASFSVFPLNLAEHIKEKTKLEMSRNGNIEASSSNLQWQSSYIPLKWFWSFSNHSWCTTCTTEKGSLDKWIECSAHKTQNIDWRPNWLSASCKCLALQSDCQATHVVGSLLTITPLWKSQSRAGPQRGAPYSRNRPTSSAY